MVGADGLHSDVRRLVFGDESRLSHFVGAYLAVLSVPKELGRDGEMRHATSASAAWPAVYGARHLDDARAVFLFRTDRELDYHHRDVPRQKELLRASVRRACTRRWTLARASWSARRRSTSTRSPSCGWTPGPGVG